MDTQSKETVKKDIRPIAGNTIQREKSTGEKIAKSFISEDAGNIKDYLIFDVVIPAVKNVIADLVEDTVGMLLFGSTRRGNRKPGTMATKVSYADYYNRGRNDSARTDRNDRKNERLEYDDIAFEVKADAIDARDQLIDIISEYDTASVADFYEICNKESRFTDNNYGWTKSDIKNMEVERTRNGYYISLPRPKQL